MLDKSIKVLRIAEDARFTMQGKNEPIIRVEFMVDDHGPFVERIPKADYTAQKRDELLTKFAREVK
jgi:hypothetical protein